MIYLDNAATTRPFDCVIEEMQKYYTESYFNPSALYAPANTVADAMDRVRTQIRDYLGGSGKIVFTSCATESNAWAFASGIKNKKGNVVVSMGEHASVYENAQALIGKGMDVRFVKLQADGCLDYDDFLQKIDENTAFVSVIHCSNETGAINDIQKITSTARRVCKNVIVHSDGVQALGKMAVNCRDLGVDLYSMSAHKVGGPKGVGALWIRDGLRLCSLLPGGGQESGARSGTENVAGIIGFGAALRVFLQTDKSAIAVLRDNMCNALRQVPNIFVNTPTVYSPYILSFSAAGVKAEILQRILADKEILIGLGSACSSRMKKNRVLSAMGQSMSRIEGSVRLSFGPMNLNDDMRFAQNAIVECITKLQNK